MMRRLFTVARDQKVITEAAEYLIKTGYKDAARQLILREIKEHPDNKQMRSFLAGLESSRSAEKETLSSHKFHRLGDIMSQEHKDAFEKSGKETQEGYKTFSVY